MLPYKGIPLLFTKTDENNKIEAAYNSRFIILPLQHICKQIGYSSEDACLAAAEGIRELKYKREFFNSYLNNLDKNDAIIFEEFAHHQSFRQTSLWNLLQWSSITIRACIAYLCFCDIKNRPINLGYHTVFRTLLKHYSFHCYLHPTIFSMIEGNYYVLQNAEKNTLDFDSFENCYGPSAKYYALQFFEIYQLLRKKLGHEASIKIIIHLPSLIFDVPNVFSFWDSFYSTKMKEVLNKTEQEDNILKERFQKVTRYFKNLSSFDYSDCVDKIAKVLNNKNRRGFFDYLKIITVKKNFAPLVLKKFLLERVLFSKYGKKYAVNILYQSVFHRKKMERHAYQKNPAIVTSNLHGVPIFFDPAVLFLKGEIVDVPGFEICLRGVGDLKKLFDLIHLRFFTLVVFFSQFFKIYEDFWLYEFLLDMNPLLEKHRPVLETWYSDVCSKLIQITKTARENTSLFESPSKIQDISYQMYDINQMLYKELISGKYLQSNKCIFDIIDGYYIHGF